MSDEVSTNSNYIDGGPEEDITPENAIVVIARELRGIRRTQQRLQDHAPERTVKPFAPLRTRPRFFVILDCIGEDARLSCSDGAVLTWITRHLAKGKRSCFPGYARLAAKTHLDRGTVIRIVRRLEQLGWLAVKRQEKGGPQASNVYTITPPAEIMAKVEKTYRKAPRGPINGTGFWRDAPTVEPWDQETGEVFEPPPE